MRNAVARRRQNFETEVEIRGHRLIVDETEDDGGGDAGPRPTELTDEQRERILVIASKCPVHKTLKAQHVEVNDSLELIEA